MTNHDTPIEIYTDGACSPNPGPGGYGVIIIRNGVRTELAGGFRNTTNNRMEILAAIEGLKALDARPDDSPERDVTVYSDSRYVVDMLNGGYAAKWRANAWMRNKKEPALNPDLWEQLLDGTAKRSVKFEWVKGHSEHPENDRCDKLAVAARQATDLPADTGYESPEPPAASTEMKQTLFEGF